MKHLNTRKNYYHKPQFSLRDFWTVNESFYISNVLYASIGNGGGTRTEGIGEIDGQVDLQTAYNSNVGAGPFGPIIDSDYSDTEYKTGSYLKSSINNHFWYGALSTLNYTLNDKISISGGLDLRYYKGEHYAEVYDLLGADYTVTNDDESQRSAVKRVGDKIGYHNDGIVKWGGLFSQAEYSNGMLSAFINISASNSAYKRIDYFSKKDLILSDTIIEDALGTHTFNDAIVSDTIIINGQEYHLDSPESEYSTTDWKYINGYTFKAGANLNLDEYNNIFFNSGYISKAPKFNNIFNRDNTLQKYYS